MHQERTLSSLGMMRWADMPTAVLDHRLSSVLLENITARLSVIDRGHRYVYANRELLEFLDRAADEVIGQHLRDVVGAAAYSGYQVLAERVFAGEALQLEGWVEYPGRGLRYLRENFIPYGPVGEAIEVVAVFGRDYTDLKAREEELAKRMAELNTSEALKTAIVDHALAALVTTDELGRIVEFNPAAESMFGRQRAAVLGRLVSEVLIPERFRGPHQIGLERMQSGGAPRILGKRVEMHALRSDGSEFPMEMVLWRTDAQGCVFYTASIADLSERRDATAQIGRQREALRQSEKLTALGSLLAGVAHELNNPLSIVMGRASLLEEKCDAYPELQADARRIHDAADRCGRIVRTFLNMARSRPQIRSCVALNQMVLAAVDMLQYGYRSHDITLELMLAEDLPPLHADGDQIGQIVMNLLVNAQQALAGARGLRRVHVQTGLELSHDSQEPRVWLQVSDNGTGIEDSARDQVFEPFFTTKPEGAGTGLGLAVSRSLAREHGGTLTLELDSTLSGASFRLSLPINGASEAGPVTAASPKMEVVLQHRVLVVDDEPELAEVMREMLEGVGYEVATAESGAVALELLATARFDAIVSDLRMPDMDGAGLWREVSTHHARLARSMLFVTGDTLSPDASEFLRSAHCAALDKPFSKTDLLTRVAELLR